ncbi:hypothetical protein FJT64_017475 [Amphibalanus amphitrite]|uniref:Gustatory receptor n=1 Tax=Amphibalanus amphitrite TaxID=1232801 RepID=A0A6A4XBQ5_AMPAM|nr:hypothetical protein FJT64_017475 [Amphibalanus amphitrite]
MKRMSVRPARTEEVTAPGRDVTQLPGVAGDVESGDGDLHLSRSARVMVALLRVTGHWGGAGCGSLIYATMLYAVLTNALFFLVSRKGNIGMKALARDQGDFSAAFKSSFFGIPDVLSWLCLSCTFFIGRRRYAGLFSEIRQALKNALSSTTDPPAEPLKSLNRRLAIILSCLVVMFVVVISIHIHLFLRAPAMECEESAASCAKNVMKYLFYTIFDIFLLLTPVKLLLAAEFAREGFRAVNAELKTMMASGGVDVALLVRLGRRQAALSAALSRLTDGLAPELVVSMAYGVVLQVSTLLLTVGSAQAGHLVRAGPEIVAGLYRAAVTVAVPCEVGQAVQDQVGRIRDSLLARPPVADVTAGQEVLLQLEATRRDLESLVDLRLYRLRRSTVLAAVSAAVTYIIVFLQFQQPEASG